MFISLTKAPSIEGFDNGSCRPLQARAHRAKLLFGLASLGAAAELHGDMTQAARLASLDAFRKACFPRRCLLSLLRC
jgi:hypothetical protein